MQDDNNLHAVNKHILDATDDEILEDMRGTYAGSPRHLGDTSELNRRQSARLLKSIAQLNESIGNFAVSSDRYSRGVLRWTVVLAILTVLLLLQTIHVTNSCADFGDNDIRCTTFVDAGIFGGTVISEHPANLWIWVLGTFHRKTN